MQRHPRADLARQTADVVQGRGLFDEKRDGVFLAAPRRTGKSTFHGPFDADALAFYRSALDELGESSVSATRSSVQKAMSALRHQEPPLVRKSARGEYAIDDVPMHAWYESLVERDGWPPTRTG